MSFKRTLVMAACVATTALSTLIASAAKKIIEVGWDTPQPTYVANNIRAMETKPFNGVVMKLSDEQIFLTTPWNATNVATQTTAIQKIVWSKFTDNYLYTNITTPSMDWFNDTHWATILANTANLAKASRLGRCKGILLDPEPYGSFNPWKYNMQTRASYTSFAAYKAKVRQRGAEFMRTIQANQAYPRIFTYFMNSIVGDVGRESDPAVRDNMLVNGAWFSNFGLLPSFLDGMLDAATPGTQIIDGNEGASYYYTTPAEFINSASYIRNICINLVAPENRTKYQQIVKVAQPIWGDYLFYLYNQSGVKQTKYLTPDEKALYAQHNTYYGLKSSNEYVWVFTMYMNWWTNTSVPYGFANALSTASYKANNYQPLGYTLTNIAAKLAY